MSQRDQSYFEYTVADTEHLMDAGGVTDDTRDIAEQTVVSPTTYDPSPVDVFSTANYSSSVFDTSPSDSSSPRKSTYLNFDALNHASDAFQSPFMGSGDSPLTFAELSPAAPEFYPPMETTNSGSAVELRDNDLGFPALAPGPVWDLYEMGASNSGPAYLAPNQTQQQPFTDDAMIMAAVEVFPNKRTKLLPEDDRFKSSRATQHYANQPIPPLVPRATSFGSSQAMRPKLRSASGTSKNITPRWTETTKERKERDSHNVVEKKYRNRLNAQYEGLMNSLPPELQLPTRTGVVGGPGTVAEQAERPLSKGEVLEKSTKYIKVLERDHARLREENELLSRNIERLCSMLFGEPGRPGG